MKLLAVVFVALVVSQTLAFPTNGNEAEIDFSKDSNVHLANDATNQEQKVKFLQQNEAEVVEEALYAYAELLKGLKQKSSAQPEQIKDQQSDTSSDVAYDQTTALCPTEPTCDCSSLKYGPSKFTKVNGDICTAFNVPYCEGACQQTHKYKAVIHQNGAEPTSIESHKCCLSENSNTKSYFSTCKRSNAPGYYSMNVNITAATECSCSSSSSLCTEK